MYRVQRAKEVGSKEFNKELTTLLGNTAQNEIKEAFANVDGLEFGQEQVVGKEDNATKVYVQDTRTKPIIGYIEFGTGTMGASGSYPTLPTTTLTFTSYGAIQHTKGWQYNYAFYQGIRENPISGQYPKAYFYTATLNLREEIKPIVRDMLSRKMEGN
jgi:hypothetical protein